MRAGLMTLEGSVFRQFDEKVPDSGLAIVVDLTRLYGGLVAPRAKLH